MKIEGLAFLLEIFKDFESCGNSRIAVRHLLVLDCTESMGDTAVLNLDICLFNPIKPGGGRNPRTAIFLPLLC